ncbi:YicC family protein [Candidatus Poribacteria bacterium]|nr:YicC family protein [Candidatus Poribacteria bacterium]
MIKSMTGFGRGELVTAFGHFTVEVKSVNSKSCNIITKIPDSLSSLETQVLNYVKSRISRGQVIVSIAIDREGLTTSKRVVVDQELAKDYYEQLQKLNENLSLGSSITLSLITSLMGVVEVQEPLEDAEKMWPSAKQVLEMALDGLIETRTIEGSVIRKDMLERLEIMNQLTDQIDAYAPEVLKTYQDKLKKRIIELIQGHLELDDTRIATEVAIMAEKSDITEEITRLRSHIQQIFDILNNSEEPIGRRLDFVLQEINREVNTIASKSNDSRISSACIDFKDVNEKMREQAQNIE